MGTFLSGSVGSLGLNRSDNDVTTVATSSLIDTLKTSAEEGVEFLGDMFTDIKEDVGDFFGNLGEEIDKACGKVSDSAKSALDTITEGWEKNALPTLKEAGAEALEFLNDTGATLSTGVVSLTEGLLRFGEALVDLGTILNTATNSIGTGIYDGYQALRGLVTGEEWESATKAMWEGTKDFVATEHVKSWYDSLYNDTSFGNWMRDNGLFDSDKVREIGSGIGYVGGIIALTVLTFGAGGAAVGATGAGTAAAGSTGITAGNMAMIAGLAGTGKGAETAWKDGAGIGEGLLYAGANGAWEAFQFWAGAKIGSPGGWGDKIAKSLFNGSKAAGAFSRIALDSADGGAEGFMQPFLKMLYKDTYTDENGNEVKLDDNILKRYAELFEQEGGMANVGGQAAFGGLLSALGEVGNLRNILKGEDNVRANPDTPRMPRQLTTAEVDAKMARYKYLKELEASEEYARFNANRGNAIAFSEYPHIDDLMTLNKELSQLSSELSTNEFIYGTEKIPHTDAAARRNVQITETNEYQKLLDSVSSKGKTLADYGGTKASNGAVTPARQATADALAVQKCKMAKNAEPNITRAMESMQSDTRHLVGLEHRLKGEDSMSRKILSDAQEMLEKGEVTTFEAGMKAATDKVGDSVRYTMICDEKTITSDVVETLNGLYEQGYQIRPGKFKNTFDSDIYRGLNVGLQAPDGTFVELQFHTSHSFSVKEETNHIFYEISRNQVVTTPEEKALADAIMREQAATIKVPKSLVTLKDFNPQKLLN